MKVLSVLIGIIIILGGVWYFLTPAPAIVPLDEETIGVETKAQPEVQVTKTDIVPGGVSKLPAGFPNKIPVETANITESYRAVYSNKGITQYTVSYTSLKGREALWTTYSDFMKDNGFTIDSTSTSKSAGQIYGSKDGDSLSAVVSVRGGLSLVQLNLLDR